MTEIKGIFVPTVWSHDGVTDYLYPTPWLKAAAVKDKAVAAHFAAQEGKHCVSVPTRRALKLAVEKYKVAVDVKVNETTITASLGTKPKPEDVTKAIDDAYSEVVPVAEWADCVAKVAVAAAEEKPVDEKPIKALPITRS